VGKKVTIVHTVDVTELGRKGGIATALKRTPEERSAAAKAAVTARWKKYYRAHPEKKKQRSSRG